jgi:hypothetical protein
MFPMPDVHLQLCVGVSLLPMPLCTNVATTREAPDMQTQFPWLAGQHVCASAPRIAPPC